MLKTRREWRRTSSSQAEPSPWRHCWTRWASCSKRSQPRTLDARSGFTPCRAPWPAKQWNVKCSRNVPLLKEHRLACPAHLNPLPTLLQDIGIAPLTLLDLTPLRQYPRLYGCQVEEVAAARCWAFCSRLSPVSLTRCPPPSPVQRGQALGHHPWRKLPQPVFVRCRDLRLLRGSCPSLAEVPSPRRPGSFLAHLRHEPGRVCCALPLWTSGRAHSSASDFPQRQNPHRRYLRHLHPRAHSRRGLDCRSRFGRIVHL